MLEPSIVPIGLKTTELRVENETHIAYLSLGVAIFAAPALQFRIPNVFFIEWGFFRSEIGHSHGLGVLCLSKLCKYTGVPEPREETGPRESRTRCEMRLRLRRSRHAGAAVRLVRRSAWA